MRLAVSTWLIIFLKMLTEKASRYARRRPTAEKPITTGLGLNSWLMTPKVESLPDTAT